MTPNGKRAGWRLRGLILAIAAGLAAVRAGADSAQRLLAPQAVLEDILRANNRGAALMEQFKHTQALEEYAKVTAGAPRWAPGFVNLGLSAFYAREIPRAEQAFREAIHLDPTLPEGHYGLGLLLKNEGKNDEALAAFEKALETDPQDADILYNIGALHARQRRFDAALPALERARQIDPNSMSIRYQLARALLQAGKREAGEKEMAAYQKIAANPKFAVPTGTQYGEAGLRARVISDYTALGGPPAPPAPVAVRFSDATAGSGVTFTHGGGGSGKDTRARAARYGSGLALGDLDGDGRIDLVFANASADGRARPAIYRGTGAFKFEDITARSGVGFEGVGMAATLADLDNDADQDLYLTHTKGGVLYENQGDGTFKEAPSARGVDVEGFALGAAWVDLDHDGDLDLFVSRLPAPGSGGGSQGGAAAAAKGAGSGPAVRFNRLQQPFEPGEGRLIGKGIDRGSVGAAFSDLDGDRDIDMVLSVPGGPDLVLENRRETGFQARGREAGLAAKGAGHGVSAGDVDGDGLVDLVFPGDGVVPARLYLNGRSRVFTARDLPLPRATATWGSVLFDVDNDADLDLAMAGQGVRLLINDGRGNFKDASADAGLSALGSGEGRAMAAADLDDDGDLDLVVTRHGGAPVLLRNEGGHRNRSLRVTPRGLNSNRDGIGTRVEVQTGALWQRREVQATSGYLAQSPPLVHFGLQDRGVADFVRLLWPGGVLQAELDVPAGQPLEPGELDRKGSSCPALFAWNGGKYAFINDVVGTGGIGMWMRPGVYGTPDPDEYVKLNPDRLLPLEGGYYFQIVENLEEITYLDETRLITLDHPKSIDVYPHEHFGTKTPPDFRLFAVERDARVFPDKVRDHRDIDVTETILKIDRLYPDGFRTLRQSGYAEMHHVSLEFPSSVVGKEGLVLFLHGWVDFEYSSSNFAAHQGGIVLTPPILEMENEDGVFAPVIEPMGFPAGMPRTMTVDLAPLGPLKGRRMRIRTNMRAYWDQIFLAKPLDAEELAAKVKVNEVALSGAHLHRRGFPREHSPDGRQPKIYDYGIMDNSQPFKVMTGDYTRFGRVTDLLTRTDDRFVIFGRGEEVTLEFPTKGLPETPKHWVRSFLLYTNGYCKDMDPHTAFPDTVEPLPFHGMSAYPYRHDESYPEDTEHREYRRTWNTRRVEDR